VDLIKRNNIQRIMIRGVDGEDYWFVQYAKPYQKKMWEGMKLDYKDVVFGGGKKGDYVLVRSLVDGSLMNITYNSHRMVLLRRTTTTTIPGAGCTDTIALNYIQTATIDDGSCEYEDKLLRLKQELESISQELKDDGIYCLNPWEDRSEYQVVDLATKLWYSSIGFVTRRLSKGYTCGDYVKHTKKPVSEAVNKIYGDEKNTRLEVMLFLERSSTYKSKGEYWGIPDFFDDLGDFVRDNHILFKLTLSDGKDYYIDFWNNAANNGPIIHYWYEMEHHWRYFVNSKQVDNDEFCWQQMELLTGPGKPGDGMLYCDGG